MRIISLNTWGGRALHPLLHFFKRRRDDADVFCLQEVYNGGAQQVLDQRHPDEHVRADLFTKISRELPGFRGWFAPFHDDPHRMSLAMFIRDGVKVKTLDHFTVHRPAQPVETGSVVISPRKLQFAVVDVDGTEVLIANYHGLWTPAGKGDSPERLEQSREVRAFTDRSAMPKVIIGDLNLDPETQSLAILGKDMVNLMWLSGIISTRTVLYREHDDPKISKFADYALVSPELFIRQFGILPDLASDHAALYLYFKLRGSKEEL